MGEFYVSVLVILVVKAIWIGGVLAVAVDGSLARSSRIRWMIFVMLVPVIGSGVALAYLHRDLFSGETSRKAGGGITGNSVEERLRQRYVSGEIGMEEYERHLETIVGSRKSQASSWPHN